ncbi:hypothetical protein HMJ29_18435 [Hymenobacter taeanensis]|uniref:Uncharacterized protein n=1 Tax=Hymenobacter taeanensis TaxID=2735321 RepID=A0A6M6BLR6_9BACT|nr:MULTISPECIES: hypothetical protein [Hymenobacter]QJX48784.1 hypothetical protein HMJ29_18435 [Hymenobacter taeanensis]UOQ81711.1 hypothetical protein MUN83_02640 [Hymenobacter sp. 5414T-23]
MKKLLLLFLLSAPALAVGQAATPVNTINFCGTDFTAPTACAPDSKYSVRCEGYQLTWMYLDYKMLTDFPEQFVRQIEKKHKHTERQALECMIMGQPAKGFRVSYPTESGMTYELIAYGVAKGQPVMVELTMDMDPEKTTDLPEMPRQIIQLSK